MKKILGATIIMLLLYATSAMAQCACCSSVGCGDNSGGGSALVKQGKFLFSMVDRYTSFKPLAPGVLQQDAAKDTTFPVYNKSYQQTYIFSLSYGITNRLNVTATLPYNSIANIQVGIPGGEAIIQGTSKGFSNLKTSLQYVLLQRQYCSGWEVIPSVGIIAPTGVHSNVGLDGTVFDDQFQPGANAWVPVVGIAGDKMFGKVTFRSSVNYVFANTDPQGNVDAALWNADASAYIMVLKSGVTVKQSGDTGKVMRLSVAESNFMMSAFGGIQLEHVGQDIVAMPDGSKAYNSNIGAFRTYANVGVVANFYHRFFIPVSLAVPVYQEENGYQVKVQYRLNVGFSVIF